MGLKDSFRSVSVTGETVMQMAVPERKRLAETGLEVLSRVRKADNRVPERDILNAALAPLFTLSGYNLRPEPVTANNFQFDFSAENIIGGDDKILVDLKIQQRDEVRTLIPNQIIELISSLDATNATRIVMVNNDKFDWPEGISNTSQFGPRLEFWTLDDVENRLRSFAEFGGDDGSLVKIMSEFVDKLAVAIAQSQVTLQSLEWRDVERVVAHVLSELGYAVHLTQGSKDGGRDVIVADFSDGGSKVYNVEIKHWTTGKVGPSETKRLLDVALKEKRSGALMLATSGASEGALMARSEVSTDYLRFGDEEKITVSCRAFLRKRQGMWFAPAPFKTFMLEKTV